ncbi:hypothetical protein DMENIID0001_015630 [Sergentomyia squamirostris]
MNKMKPSSSNSDDTMYQVEKILDRREVRKRKLVYLIKWEGYSDYHNSWEPAKNICPVMVAEFERSLQSASKNSNNDDLKEMQDIILGATTDDNDHLMFLIKWKGDDNAELVSAKEANMRIPQTVIAFYEEHIKWITLDEKANGNE